MSRTSSARFTGDRQALARGDSRVELGDAEVLQDVDAIVAYLRTLPDVDGSRIAMIGVCQTGRQPVLLSAYRDYLAGIVVLYGAIYNADWESQPLRPEPIDTLLERFLSSPGDLWRAGQPGPFRQRATPGQRAGQSQEEF